MQKSLEIEEAVEDRRVALRQPCREETLDIEHPTLGRHTARVLDISRSGVRIAMDVCIPCGEGVLVLAPPERGLLNCRARIMRQRVLDIGEETWFECGIRFTEEAELRRHSWFLTLRRSE